MPVMNPWRVPVLCPYTRDGQPRWGARLTLGPTETQRGYITVWLPGYRTPEDARAAATTYQLKEG